MDRSTLTRYGALAALGTLLVCWLLHGNGGTSELTAFKYNDAFAYYSAATLFRDGANPYDQVSLDSVQASLGYPEGSEPLRSLYAPWFYLVTGPLSALTLAEFQVVWMGLGLALLFAGAAGAWAASSGGTLAPARCALLAVYSLPLVDCLLEGQVAGFQVAGLGLFAYGLAAGRPRSAGAALLLLTLKPHLFFPLAVATAWGLGPRDRIRVASGLAIALGTSSIAVELLHPGVHGAWLGRMSNPPLILTASFSGLIWRTTGESPRLVCGLLLSAVTLAALGIRARMDRAGGGAPTVSGVLRFMPIGIFLSVVGAPYLWISDYAVLTVPTIMTVAAGEAADRTERGRPVLPILAAELLAFVITWVYVRESAAFWWYPFIRFAGLAVYGIPHLAPRGMVPTVPVVDSQSPAR